MDSVRNQGDLINKFVRQLSWGMVADLLNTRGSHDSVARDIDERMPWFRAHYEAVTGKPLTDVGLRNIIATKKERYLVWPCCQRVPPEWYGILPQFLYKAEISGRDIAEAIGKYPKFTHDCAEFGLQHEWYPKAPALLACKKCTVTKQADTASAD